MRASFSSPNALCTHIVSHHNSWLDDDDDEPDAKKQKTDDEDEDEDEE